MSMFGFFPILADISAEDVGKIISMLVGGGGLCYCSYSFGKAKSVHVSPQPLEVTASKQYATKEELEELRDELRSDINKIYDKVNKTSEMLASNSGTLHQINSTLSQLLSRHIK